MKRKFAVVNRLSVLIMTLVSLALFLQNGICAAAQEQMQVPAKTGTAESSVSAPENSLVRTFRLAPDETAQVPRRIAEGDAMYELDEASIVVQETERGSGEGADVVTFSKKVENLPDNDLSRIEKQAVIEGFGCELLSVAYKVEEEDENGMPVCYSALCEYGALKKYSTSYPTAWQIAARYDLRENIPGPKIVEVREVMEVQAKKGVRRETEYDGTGTKRVDSEPEEAEREANLEKEPVYLPQIERIMIKPSPEEEDKKEIADLFWPLAAAAAGTGVTVPFLIWFWVLTAPLFALKSGEKYRYIGRIRLKREEETYVAYLSKRLRDRAELPVFQIKLPGKVWKTAKKEMLRIHCPGGKRIMATVGRIVCFTVEED